MFTGKILPKMAPHGLAFGEHCVDLVPYSRKPFIKTRNLKNSLKFESSNDHQGTYPPHSMGTKKSTPLWGVREKLKQGRTF
jgi:hypothetical protein